MSFKSGTFATLAEETQREEEDENDENDENDANDAKRRDDDDEDEEDEEDEEESGSSVGMKYRDNINADDPSQKPSSSVSNDDNDIQKNEEKRIR